MILVLTFEKSRPGGVPWPVAKEETKWTVKGNTCMKRPNDHAIARVLQKNEKDAARSETRDPLSVDPGRPVYTRMSRRYLSVETLRVHGIDYELDTVSSHTAKKYILRILY